MTPPEISHVLLGFNLNVNKKVLYLVDLRCGSPVPLGINKKRLTEGTCLVELVRKALYLLELTRKAMYLRELAEVPYLWELARKASYLPDLTRKVMYLKELARKVS